MSRLRSLSGGRSSQPHRALSRELAERLLASAETAHAELASARDVLAATPVSYTHLTLPTIYSV